MADKLSTLKADDTVVVGPFEAAVGTLTGMPAEDVNKNGIVLANERRKLLIPHTDDGGQVRFVVYTISTYIQREPLDDNESDRVNKAAADRQAKAEAKAKQTQDERERAIKASFELGQQATMTALQNIGTLAQGAATLQKLAR